LRNNLKKHSLALASLSRTITRLRSRIGWIKDGDANTALFHASARYRKAKNFIPSVISREGQTLTSHEDKAAEFAEFYEGLLGTQENRDDLGLGGSKMVMPTRPSFMLVRDTGRLRISFPL
jgi:hypothetical protein